MLRPLQIVSDGRAIQKLPGNVHGTSVTLTVKVHPQGDVWEYVDGVPREHIGKQLFTYPAALRELGNHKMLADEQSFVNYLHEYAGDTEEKQYHNFFAEHQALLAGCWSPGKPVFDDLGVWGFFWLADANRIGFSSHTWNIARRDEAMGYLVLIVS